MIKKWNFTFSQCEQVNISKRIYSEFIQLLQSTAQPFVSLLIWMLMNLVYLCVCVRFIRN